MPPTAINRNKYPTKKNKEDKLIGVLSILGINNSDCFGSLAKFSSRYARYIIYTLESKIQQWKKKGRKSKTVEVLTASHNQENV